VNIQRFQYGFSLSYFTAPFHHYVAQPSIRGGSRFVDLSRFTQFQRELVVKRNSLVAVQSPYHPVARDVLPKEHI